MLAPRFLQNFRNPPLRALAPRKGRSKFPRALPGVAQKLIVVVTVIAVVVVVVVVLVSTLVSTFLRLLRRALVGISFLPCSPACLLHPFLPSLLSSFLPAAIT